MKMGSHKRLEASGENHEGCLSALVSIFIHPSSHKLLSYRKRRGCKHSGTVASRRCLDLPVYMETSHEDIVEVDGRAKLDNLGMPQTLIEEEMSITHTTKIKNSELEVQTDLGALKFGSGESSSTNATRRHSIDFHLAAFIVKFYCQNYHYQDKQDESKYISCSAIEDIENVSNSHCDKPDSLCSCTHSSLEKALDEKTEIFLRQKFTDLKLAGNGQNQSGELIDALDILNSNDLFLKFIHDIKSLTLEQIQDLDSDMHRNDFSQENIGSSDQDQEPIQSEEQVTKESFKKKIRQSLFRKKDKSKETKQLKECDSSQAINRIVVLKPSSANYKNASTKASSSSSPHLYHGAEHKRASERPISKFSFKEIKWRLRQVIGEGGKDKHVISTDSNLHATLRESECSCDIGKNVTNESYAFASKTSCNPEVFKTPLTNKKSDKKSKLKETGLPTLRASYFYEEAKKHLVDMLATIDEMDRLQKKEMLQPLQNIVSSPGYSIVTNYRELELTPHPKRFFPSHEFDQENSVHSLSPLRQSSGSSTTCSRRNVYDGTQVTGPTPVCTASDSLKPKESRKMVKDTLSEPSNGEQIHSRSTNNLDWSEASLAVEGHDNLGMLSESNGKEPYIESERCREVSCTIFDLGPSVDKLEVPVTTTSISRSLDIKELENLEEMLENPERPSPISVLEAVFSEDTMSLGSTTDDYGDFPQQSEQVYSGDHDSSANVQPSSDSEGTLKYWLGDEDIIGFLTTLLEASGLSFNETSERWHLSDQFLEHSLLKKVGTSLSNDPYVIFDCINEVLAETQERLFGCTPWVSLIKHSTQVSLRGGNLIGEVCKGIDRHFHHIQLPSLLDEHEVENWTDIFETEDLCFQMADVILEEMVDRTVLELWV